MGVSQTHAQESNDGRPSRYRHPEFHCVEESREQESKSSKGEPKNNPSVEDDLLIPKVPSVSKYHERSKSSRPKSESKRPDNMERSSLSTSFDRNWGPSSLLKRQDMRPGRASTHPAGVGIGRVKMQDRDVTTPAGPAPLWGRKPVIEADSADKPCLRRDLDSS